MYLQRGPSPLSIPPPASLSCPLPPRRRQVPQAAFDKAKQHKFFLGLDSEYGWLDAL